MTIWYNWQLYRYKSQFSSVPGQITIGKCPGTIANRTGTNHNCYLYQDRSQLTTVLVQLCQSYRYKSQLSSVPRQITIDNCPGTIVNCTGTNHNCHMYQDRSQFILETVPVQLIIVICTGRIANHTNKVNLHAQNRDCDLLYHLHYCGKTTKSI